jgi:hypothetical protein
VIATPVPSYDLAKRKSQAGKRVFVEKPPAMASDEIDEGCQLATGATSSSCPAICCSTTLGSSNQGLVGGELGECCVCVQASGTSGASTGRNAWSLGCDPP